MLIKTQDNKRKIHVHMHERLSASTDFRPLRPDVASDKRGLGSERTGISVETILGAFRRSEFEEWDSLR